MHIDYCRQSGIVRSGPAGRAARAGLWTAFLSRSSESWFVPDEPPRLRSLSELGIWGRFPDRDYNLRACRNRRCDLRHPHEWYRGSGLTGNPGPMVSDTWPSSVEVAWGVPIISVPLPKPISQYSKFDVNVQKVCFFRNLYFIKQMWNKLNWPWNLYRYRSWCRGAEDEISMLQLWSTFFIAQNKKMLSSNGEALKQNIVFSLTLPRCDLSSGRVINLSWYWAMM